VDDLIREFWTWFARIAPTLARDQAGRGLASSSRGSGGCAPDRGALIAAFA